jgi:hypothetical protein
LKFAILEKCFADALQISAKFVKLSKKTYFSFSSLRFGVEKIFLILITLLIACLALAGCGFQAAKSETKVNSNTGFSTGFAAPRQIATLADSSVDESSGIVASRKNAGVFWTHNDSGDGAFLYAFDKSGKKLGVWLIAGATNKDWEDIAIQTDAAGESFIFVGDIGDNERKRGEIQIYKIVEPEITAADAASTKKNPRVVKGAEKIRLAYPDGAHDAETLLVNPTNDDLYILTKNLIGKAAVYKLSAPFQTNGARQILTKIAEIGVPSPAAPGLVTGGEIAPDGKRMALTDYFAAYEYSLPVNASDFDEIWRQTPVKIDVGERAQGESICYSPDGNTLYLTSEKRPTPLIEVRKQ